MIKGIVGTVEKWFGNSRTAESVPSVQSHVDRTPAQSHRVSGLTARFGNLVKKVAPLAAIPLAVAIGEPQGMAQEGGKGGAGGSISTDTTTSIETTTVTPPNSPTEAVQKNAEPCRKVDKKPQKPEFQIDPNLHGYQHFLDAYFRGNDTFRRGFRKATSVKLNISKEEAEILNAAEGTNPKATKEAKREVELKIASQIIFNGDINTDSWFETMQQEVKTGTGVTKFDAYEKTLKGVKGYGHYDFTQIKYFMSTIQGVRLMNPEAPVGTEYKFPATLNLEHPERNVDNDGNIDKDARSIALSFQRKFAGAGPNNPTKRALLNAIKKFTTAPLVPQKSAQPSTPDETVGHAFFREAIAAVGDLNIGDDARHVVKSLRDMADDWALLERKGKTDQHALAGIIAQFKAPPLPPCIEEKKEEVPPIPHSKVLDSITIDDVLDLLQDSEKDQPASPKDDSHKGTFWNDKLIPRKHRSIPADAPSTPETMVARRDSTSSPSSPQSVKVFKTDVEPQTDDVTKVEKPHPAVAKAEEPQQKPGFWDSMKGEWNSIKGRFSQSVSNIAASVKSLWSPKSSEHQERERLAQSLPKKGIMRTVGETFWGRTT